MTKARWKKRIEEACKSAGTYQEFYDSVIDTLAGIMETRDRAQKEFAASGRSVTVEHTNQGGNTNTVKNPALLILMDCNTQALNYWKELGLTARSYKQMTGSINVQVENASLEEALAGLKI